MNDTLLFQIADRIEAEPERYDQTEYFTEKDCGTAYCVAGWAVAIGHPGALLPDGTIECNNTHRLATDLLGIEPRTAEGLFDMDAVPLQGLTVPEALRQMAREKRFIPEIWGPLEEASDSTIDPASTTGLGSVAPAS